MERWKSDAPVEPSRLISPGQLGTLAFKNRVMFPQASTPALLNVVPPGVKESSPADSEYSAGRLLLIDLAGFLYTTSLHKFFAPSSAAIRYGRLVIVRLPCHTGHPQTISTLSGSDLFPIRRLIRTGIIVAIVLASELLHKRGSLSPGAHDHLSDKSKRT